MEKKNGKKKSSTKTTKSVKEEVEVVVEETKPEKEVPKKEVISDKKQPKKTSHFLFKALAISIFVAIILSWIIPAGTFSSATITTTDPARTGINETFLAMFYASNYYLLQVVFVLVVGLFYGVLSRTNGYKKLVDNAAEFWIGKKKWFALVHTIIIALFVSMATQSFPILLFIPLILNIYKYFTYHLKTIINTHRRVTIYLNNGKVLFLNGFIDTGNSLIDPYTNKKVIIINKYVYENYYLVPYKTVDNESLLKCFKPNRVYIEGIGERHDVVVGVVKKKFNGYDCLLNYELMEG